jgi:hypothetical protein
MVSVGLVGGAPSEDRSAALGASSGDVEAEQANPDTAATRE